jgi:hypothetical protein
MLLTKIEKAYDSVGREVLYNILIEFVFYCCDAVGLCLCGTGPLMGPLSILRIIHECI